MSYRIVFDTNVLVSAVLNQHGSSALILDAVLDGKFFLVISHAVINGARRVFSFPKLQQLFEKNGIEPREINEVLKKLAKITVFVPGKARLNSIASDPSDNIFLSCAVEGQADFVISGDRHLTGLGVFQGIRIASPKEFLDLIGQEGFKKAG
ncbi:MAG: putative toxin-antitoxin system toxin component, PIN family [Desulfobacterales bacterium]